MDACVNIRGELDIPEEQKPQLTRRVRTIFDLGGVMDIGRVEMFGRTIPLLRPPWQDDSGRLLGRFSYFDCTFLEDCGYTPEQGVCSNRVTGPRAREVIYAACLQEEAMSLSFCLTEVDGAEARPCPAAGWLNGLFGEHYDLRHRQDGWRLAQFFHDLTGEDRVDEARIRGALPFPLERTPHGLPVLLSGDLSSLDRRLAEVSNDPNARFYVNVLTRSREAMQTLLAAMGKEDLIHLVIDLLLCCEPAPEGTEWPPDEACEKAAVTVVLLACSLQAPIVVRLLAEVTGEPFWTLWARCRGRVGIRCIFPEPEVTAIPSFSTEAYLGLTSGDRLYWWSPGSQRVTLDAEDEEWLFAMLDRYNAYLSDGTVPTLSSQAFLEQMVADLDVLARSYGRALFFEEAFYEFLRHSGEREFQMMWRVLEELMEKHRDERRPAGSWEMYGCSPKKYPGRAELRRYLALLANPVLRMDVFEV